MTVLRVGSGVRFGSGGYPWDSFNSVHAWIAHTSFLDLDASNGVQNWYAQKSTVAGALVTQATEDNRPTYDATGINSLPAISFDGTNDELFNTIQSGIYTLSDGDDTDCTMIILCDLVSTASGSQIMGFFNAGSPRYRLIRAGSAYRVDRTTSSTITFQNTSNGVQLLTARFTNASTNQYFYKDGVEDPSSPQTSDIGTFASDSFGISPGSLGIDYPEMLVAGFWIVENDDLGAISAIETWALNRGGL